MSEKLQSTIEWIKVEDRLPKKDMGCLFICKDRNVYVGHCKVFPDGVYFYYLYVDATFEKSVVAWAKKTNRHSCGTIAS